MEIDPQSGVAVWDMDLWENSWRAVTGGQERVSRGWSRMYGWLEGGTLLDSFDLVGRFEFLSNQFVFVFSYMSSGRIQPNNIHLLAI